MKISDRIWNELPESDNNFTKRKVIPYPEVKAYTILDKSPKDENRKTALKVLKTIKETMLKKIRINNTTSDSLLGISNAA